MKSTLETYKNVYFIGIGGIGMSALARYFKMKNWNVSGYDKTPSPLTDELVKEGIDVHFEDLGNNIPTPFSNAADTLVVYTPAIPASLGEYTYFQNNNFKVLKRAAVLGMITRASKGLGVAGTHGKTTTSTLLAHILNESHLKCNAFLGGISSNFNTNFVASTTSEFTVIEADEFDRSFLQLNPFASIITSTDADHLDIYGNAETFLKGFQDYANQINPEGFLILRKGLEIQSPATIQTYAIDEDADFKGQNLRTKDGHFYMDMVTETSKWNDIELGLPGIHNAENALGCIALCLNLGLSEEEIRHGLASFKGVKRRFEFHIRTKELIYIDDYAHHPTEIKALVSSVRLLYPGQKITGIFQPHLYSRTKDFMQNFANELSQVDELILMPIYPAREEPMEGITSDALLAMCSIKDKKVWNSEEVIEHLKNQEAGVFLSIGAGDIDRIVPKIKSTLSKNLK
ncbi:MAG: UDP-N-acetylmuramate--L-alanine ligase [Crocinitomicaceae bacterium]|nr:UDP-N-acetylmuramate--L-alanine ligase [Crocinitomicaceae bacterium]